MNKCRYHSNVFKEGRGYFACINDALKYEKNNPQANGEIYTHDGYLLKENFICKCNGRGWF